MKKAHPPVKGITIWKTLEDFINVAKKSPGNLRYSHPGTAAMNHMAALALEKMADISISGIPKVAGARP